jgi:hypothetical protein
MLKERPMNNWCKAISKTLAIPAILLTFFPSPGHAQNAAPATAAVSAQPAAPVLVAKINGSLSTKNAKVGDVLTAKTLKAWKLADGTDLPKGSKLIAKVAAVQSKQAGNGNSMLTFRIDQAEVKGGAAVPVHAMVVAIGPSLGPEQSIGANSVLGRNGVGSDSGLDPNTGVGKVGAMNEDDIPLGSTLEGVALGRHLDADWTAALQGVKRDIQLDSDVLIKVQFK